MGRKHKDDARTRLPKSDGASKPHRRPPPVPPREQLIAIRKAKYPDMLQKEFAQRFLGVTAHTVLSVEVGRRHPSLDLAIRWIAALAPEAKLSMFGQTETLEKQLKAFKELQELAPKVLAAA